MKHNLCNSDAAPHQPQTSPHVTGMFSWWHPDVSVICPAVLALAAAFAFFLFGIICVAHECQSVCLFVIQTTWIISFTKL